jgi:tetratricopeptide (TPR) repeat protein
VMNRLAYLLELQKEQPDDPFILYGIALEHQKNNDPETAAYFDQLLKEFPTYLPSYYQAASCFAEAGASEKALFIYDKGIKLAQDLNELKTLVELKNAKQNLEMDLL